MDDTFIKRFFDEKNLNYYEIIDYYDTGEMKWYLKDNNGNSTPIFSNKPSIIPTSKVSCILLGEDRGETRLYYVNAMNAHTGGKLYTSYKLDGDAINIKPVASNRILVSTFIGDYFYDTDLKHRNSGIFDKIAYRKGDTDTLPIFEKTIVRDDFKMTVYGTVTYEGHLGDFIYDGRDAFVSTPRIKNEFGVEEIDYDSLYNVLRDNMDEINARKEKNIKVLAKMNGVKGRF